MTRGNILKPFTSLDKNGRGYGLYYSRIWDGGDGSIPKYKKIPPVPAFHDFVNGLDLRKISRRNRIQALEAAYESWRMAKDSRHAEMLRQQKERDAHRLALKRSPHNYTSSLQTRIIPLMDWAQPNLVARGYTSYHEENVSAETVFPAGANLADPWTSNDDIALINKIRNRLDGGVGFHAGVALAEADESLRMIGSSAKRFRRVGESLAAGNLNKAARTLINGSSAHYVKGFAGLNAVASNYLLWQFGVRPLLHDVVDAARALGYLSERPALQKISVRRKLTAEASLAGLPYGARSSIVSSGQIIAYLRANPSADVSLAPIDLPSIVWERIPYSFVVDWWVPVGAYLEAQQLARSVDALFVKTRVSKRNDFGPTSGNDPSALSYYSIELHGKYLKRTVNVSRVVSTKLTVPPPTMKPLFHPDAEVRLRHTMEAVALIALRGKALSKGFSRIFTPGTRLFT